MQEGTTEILDAVHDANLCRRAPLSLRRTSWSGCCHSSTPGSSGAAQAQTAPECWTLPAEEHSADKEHKHSHTLNTWSLIYNSHFNPIFNTKATCKSDTKTQIDANTKNNIYTKTKAGGSVLRQPFTFTIHHRE